MSHHRTHSIARLAAGPLRLARPFALVAALALPVSLAACGSSSSSSSASSAPASSAPASSAAASSSAPASPSGSASASSTGSGGGGEPTAGPRAVASIEANWAAFFDAKTPNSRRVALLQNGQLFAAVITAQSTNPLSASASAKVTSVTLTGTSQASVTYDILVGGTPALSGQHGVAIYENGIWKVGDASFCGLLRLENGGKTTGLPASCKG